MSDCSHEHIKEKKKMNNGKRKNMQNKGENREKSIRFLHYSRNKQKMITRLDKEETVQILKTVIPIGCSMKTAVTLFSS